MSLPPRQKQLLKKFWGSFTPLPLTPLVEYGPFIYKCYTTADDTVAVLTSREQHPTAPHLLEIKLRQYDLPLSVRLMERLLLLESMGGRNASNTLLYNTLVTFRRMLSVYQENILLFLAEHLAREDGGASLGEIFSTERISQLNVIIREFLRAKNNIFTFLSGCVLKLSGFEKLQPPSRQLPVMEKIMEDISAFGNHQKKTRGILESWRRQQTLQTLQQQRN